VQDLRPMIETLPLEKAPEAFARMMDGKTRFRMVLVNGKD
jgi:D-arabinose 1-dehydrogenase-like Zn-dependent alcohol dehydrogenase